MSTPKILRVAPILPPFGHIFSQAAANKREARQLVLRKRTKNSHCFVHWYHNLLRTYLTSTIISSRYDSHCFVHWYHNLLRTYLTSNTIISRYEIKGWKATLCCDNKSALEQSAYTRRRIRPSAKCADIQRSLKATQHTFTGKFSYLHVYGHMDKYLLWHQLSLIQQLNCVCDTLAKQAVTLAMTLRQKINLKEKTPF